MMLLGLVVLFLVIRPLVKRILATEEIAALASAPVPALPEPAQGAGGGAQAIAGPNATAHLIDVAQVQGQVHAQSVHRVGELAERNPNETVAIVRQWLSETAAT
jgi:flagellar M-ring protein FliF